MAGTDYGTLGIVAVVAAVAAVGLLSTDGRTVVVQPSSSGSLPDDLYVGPPETTGDDGYVGPPEKAGDGTSDDAGEATAGAREGATKCTADIREMLSMNWKKPCTMEVAEMQCPTGEVTYTAKNGCQISFLSDRGWTRTESSGGVR